MRFSFNLPNFGPFADPRLFADLARAVEEAGWDGLLTQYVTIDNIEILPTPVQHPRVPIWVGGGWPGRPSMRRAARWDGAIPIMLPDPSASPSPDFVRESLTFIHGLRAKAGIDDQPFELVLGGTTAPGAPALDRVGPLAEAGATWWDERMPYSPELVDADATRRRIEAGPPQLD